MRSLDAPCDTVSPARDLGFERTTLMLLVELPDHEPAAGSDRALEKMGHEVGPPRRGNVLQPRPNHVEPVRRLPVERVADEDPLGPGGKALARERRELR